MSENGFNPGRNACSARLAATSHVEGWQSLSAKDASRFFTVLWPSVCGRAAVHPCPGGVCAVVIYVALFGHFAQAFRSRSQKHLLSIGVESGRQLKMITTSLQCSIPCFGASTGYMHRLRFERGRSLRSRASEDGAAVGAAEWRWQKHVSVQMEMGSGRPRGSAGLEGCRPRHRCSMPPG